MGNSPTTVGRGAGARLVGVLGVGLFVATMAVGYAYNVTFVQLGLTDLGERVLGLDRAAVAALLASLALVTAATACVTGFLLRRRGLGRDLRALLRIAFGVVVVQTVLTALAPGLPSAAAFATWLAAAGVAIGVGVPATFGLTVHLVPTRFRPAAAAAVTATAYATAALLSGDWSVEMLAGRALLVMVPGLIGLGVLAFVPNPLVAAWSRQHLQGAFWYGRFVRPAAEGGARPRRRLVALALLMFAVFFVDSLGFLRLVDTPRYVLDTWRSLDVGPRAAIAAAHVAGALVAGVLYRAFGERHLITWVLGLFVLVHFGYVVDAGLPGDGGGVLMLPVLYAVAVSLYTVVAFAVWADLSTPDTITVHAAFGVAASAWTATFLSTAVALRWQAAGVPLDVHLRAVEAIALAGFVAMLLLAVLPWGGRGARPQAERRPA